VVDCFDRRVSRELFLDVLANSLYLHDFIGCLNLTSRIQHMAKESKLTEAMLDSAVKEFISSAEGIRASLLGRMEKVVECAPSWVTKH